jgi:molybdopterin-containing oxidoreductase family molybdopterin binding subunit
LMYCGLLAHVKDGKLEKLEPADFPDPKFNRICLKGLSQIQQVYHPERLKYPMKRVGKRGEGKWQRISWDEALDTIATKLKKIMGKYGPTAVLWFRGGLGAISEAPKRLASLLHGTFVELGLDSNGPQAALDTFGCAWYLTPDRKHFFGGSNEVADCINSRLIILWGANMSETLPHYMPFIFDAMEKGARLVVVDPRFSPTASKAHKWIPIRPGTDACLALSMINVIINENLHDKTFIANHTVGPFLVRSDNRFFLRERDMRKGGSNENVVWDTSTAKGQTYDNSSAPALTGIYTCNGIECKPAFQRLIDLVAQYEPKTAETITGVSEEDIRKFAIEYATNKPASFGLLHGLDRWHHGNLSYRAVFTLTAITGQIGIRGGGHFTSGLGFAFNDEPWLFPEGKRPEKINPLEMFKIIPTGKPYPIKALWVYRGNFFRNADANKIIGEILPSLEFILVADRFMTQTAEYADIVLPVCSSFETNDVINGPFPYVQLQQKVIEPLYESKSDFEITAEVAKRMGFGKYFDKSVEEYIALLLQNLDGITVERLRKEGAVPVEIGKRPYVSFLEKNFPTPSGRVEFYVERGVEFGQELPVYIEAEEGTPKNPLARKYPLVFLQTHSRFHAHTTFANNPWLLEINPEPLLEINPVDAQERNIQNGDLVVVFNDRGMAKLKARLNEGIRPGVVDVHHGWWFKQFVEGGYQCLTHAKINPALRYPNFSYFDCLVEVKKA